MLAVILIINWNGMAWLERCLPAVFKQPLDFRRVVVVDNGSTDGSAEWVSLHFPQARLIRLAQNAGFAAANNIGIAQTDSRYVITLNNDTEVAAGWLSSLIDAAEADAAIGCCASRIMLADQPHIIDSAGIEVDLFGFAWQRGHGQPDSDAYRLPCDVFGASAAAALYRRTMLQAIGAFDEDFGSYYEDVDLAWRAHRAGWRCRYVPNAVVAHVHSATGRRDLDQKHYFVARNRWWTMARNYPSPRFWFLLPLIAAADALSLARGLALLRNRVPLRARLDALRGLRTALQKRRALQSLPRADEL